MEYFKLNRLAINEHHGDDFTDELLSMTVGEVLDRLGAIDTESNAEYEVIEAALKAVASTVLAKAKPVDNEDDIEMSNKFDMETNVREPEFKEFPTYSDTLDAQSHQQQDGLGIEDFKF